MPSVNGVVQAVSKNTYGFFSLKVNEEWYSNGKNMPPVDKGDAVAFEFNTQQRGKYTNNNIVAGTLHKTAVQVGAATPSTGPAPSSNRDLSITYQSARKDALTLASTLLANGVLKLPTKKEDQMDAVIQFVDSMTEVYWSDAAEVVEGNRIPSATMHTSEPAPDVSHEDD